MKWLVTIFGLQDDHWPNELCCESLKRKRGRQPKSEKDILGANSSDSQIREIAILAGEAWQRRRGTQQRILPTFGARNVHFT